MAEAVVVGVRVRPMNAREIALNAELCVEMQGKKTIIRNDARQAEHEFTFDASFWSFDEFEDDETGYSRPVPGGRYADQRFVYETFGQRVLDNAWNGFHCCLFAYGQTGSGKSYSMVGYGANQGIVPISCEQIFARINANTDANLRFEVSVSMVEIYNETVQDLLIDPDMRPKRGLEIRESKMLGIYIDGVTKRAVCSYAAIDAVVEEATQNRTIGATQMNATSSRAHTVITIEFKQVDASMGKESVKMSMINLVDLAGSEKSSQTKATGDRMREGNAINKSLSALGLVIEKLAQRSSGKRDVLIPYRDSKLTRLLQNALGGSSKTIMICALSPATSNYEETLSTLRYADRAKKIKNKAEVNENPQDKLVRELKEENAKLKVMMEKISAGEVVDPTVLEEKQKEVERAEAALEQMRVSFEAKLQEAREQAAREAQRMRGSAMIRISRKDSGCNPMADHKMTVPHIMNLNEDMALTGKIKWEFQTGTTTIGQIGGSKRVGGRKSLDTIMEDEELSDDESYVDTTIQLHGEGIYGHHAAVTNDGNECILSASWQPAQLTCINGKTLIEWHRLEHLNDEELSVHSFQHKLMHKDRIAFGRECRSIFVFVNPKEQPPIESAISRGEVSYAMAKTELFDCLWKQAGLMFLRHVEDENTSRRINNILEGKDPNDDLPAGASSSAQHEELEALRNTVASKDAEIQRLKEALEQAQRQPPKAVWSAAALERLRLAGVVARKMQAACSVPITELAVVQDELKKSAEALDGQPLAGAGTPSHQPGHEAPRPPASIAVPESTEEEWEF